MAYQMTRKQRSPLDGLRARVVGARRGHLIYAAPAGLSCCMCQREIAPNERMAMLRRGSVDASAVCLECLEGAGGKAPVPKAC